MKKVSAILLAVCVGGASFAVMAADDMAKTDAGATSAAAPTKRYRSHLYGSKRNHPNQVNQGNDSMTKKETYESGK